MNLGDEDQTIENGGDLLKLPVSEVLSDERVKAVLSTNLFEVKELSGENMCWELRKAALTLFSRRMKDGTADLPLPELIKG